MSRYETRLLATAFLCAALSLSAGCAADEKTGSKESDITQQKIIENYASDAALNKAELKKIVAPFFEDPVQSETRAVVIMHRGKIVAERYAPGYGPDSRLISWSMAKSVTAVLVGLMVADGRLVLDDPAPVPEWASAGDPRGKITLRHLLHMTAGLDHSEVGENGKPIYEADTPRMLFTDGREAVARYAEKRPMEAAPGEKFEYSTATSHILVDIMTRNLTQSDNPEVRRQAMLDYANGRLFEPLGMTSMVPQFDRSGTMLGGSMMHATARDWAKFGEFLRNNGSVASAQLLPTSWTRFMRTSSEQDAAYGGHIWLNKKRPKGRDQVLFPDRAPDDVFSALGHLGQFVLVSPQHKLTIVRLGKTQEADMKPIDNQLARVIAAFPKG